MKILYVEDDPTISRITLLLLKRNGHEVDHYPTCEHAVLVIENGGQWDLVITDFKAPPKNGFDVAREAIAAGIPVLIWSGENFLTKPEDLQNVRVMDKPCHIDELMEVAREITGKS